MFSPNQLHDREDKTQKEIDGKRLPVFRVYPHCVMAEDCCRDGHTYEVDAQLGRALCLSQPATEEELQFHRDMAQACPVKAIVEANSWEEMPSEEEAKPAAQ